MHVQVLLFGILKDWLGASALTIELRSDASVGELLERVSKALPANLPALATSGIAVSVNAEFANTAYILHEGDEVGLLPPVSGGGPDSNEEAPTESIALTRQPIDAEKLLAAAKHGEDGAVVVFDGIVRNNTRGRQTLHLDYEAYEEMAARQMHQLAREARDRFGVRHVTLIHRLGRLQVGETSVLIVVASAHRGAAYEASRWLIDTLKKTVPIWKKETFVDGVVWAAGEPFPAEFALTPPEASREA